MEYRNFRFESKRKVQSLQLFALVDAGRNLSNDDDACCSKLRKVLIATGRVKRVYVRAPPSSPPVLIRWDTPSGECIRRIFASN